MIGWEPKDLHMILFLISTTMPKVRYSCCNFLYCAITFPSFRFISFSVYSLYSYSFLFYLSLFFHFPSFTILPFSLLTPTLFSPYHSFTFSSSLFIPFLHIPFLPLFYSLTLSVDYVATAISPWSSSYFNITSSSFQIFLFISHNWFLISS